MQQNNTLPVHTYTHSFSKQIKSQHQKGIGLKMASYSVIIPKKFLANGLELLKNINVNLKSAF